MASRHSTRLVLATALLAGLLPQASLAEPTLLWTQKTSGGFVTLSYGPLDPQKSLVFMLSCLNGMGIAVLTVRPNLPETEPGSPLTIELAGSGVTASVAGEAARDETTGTTYGEASDIEITPIIEVLRADGPVTIKAGASSLELTDNGRAKPVDQFTKDCELD